MAKVSQTALNTGLLTAAATGDLDALRRCLRDGAHVDARTEWDLPALVLAADGVHPAIVRELIAHGADVNARREGGETALMTAVTRNAATIVDALLDAGADTDAQNHWGNTALHLSSVYGNIDLARALLEAGASMTVQNKEGFDVRAMAVKNKQADFVKLLDAAESLRFTEDLKDFNDGLDRDVTIKNPVSIQKKHHKTNHGPKTSFRRSFTGR